MTHRIDLYFSFRSPYSYLITPQLEVLRQRYDLAIDLKVVRPIAVRIPGFFKQVNPLWPPYLARDTWRIAQRLGIPYRWPRPDPIIMDMASGEVAAQQPYIMGVSRMGAAAQEAGRGFEFAREASRAIWSGAVENWHEGDHLALAAAAAGLPASLAAEDLSRLDAIIEQNEAAQTAAGHWGVPLMVFNGEPFFGQDRLEDIVWRMRGAGLEER
ncbi:MAG TPA: DsbA family protein [Caulobacteraceae bacterium]